MAGQDPDDDVRLSWAPFGATTAGDLPPLPPLPDLPPLGEPEAAVDVLPERSDRAEWRAAQLEPVADLPWPAAAEAVDEPVAPSAPPPAPPDPGTRAVEPVTTTTGETTSSSQGGAAVGLAIASFFTLGLVLGGIALLLAIGTLNGRARVSQKLLAALALVLVTLHAGSWAVGRIGTAGL